MFLKTLFSVQARETMDSGAELSPNTTTDDPSSSELIYLLYKRRWHGVLMLILMNLISGWAVSISGPMSFVAND